MIELLHLAALSGYLGAWAALVRALRTGQADQERLGWQTGLAATGVHLLALAAFAWRHGAPPLVGIGPASSSLALVVALLLFAACVRAEARPLALFVLPISVFLTGEAIAVGLVPTPQQTEFRGVWLAAHVTTTFVGYAGLALASASAATYLLQLRSLERKEFGSAFRFFPSLEALHRLEGLALAVGFAGLTLGLVAGWSWTVTYGRGLTFPRLEVTFGVLTWAVYGAAIVVRLASGREARRGAWASTAAFAVTAVAFVLLKVTGGREGFFL